MHWHPSAPLSTPPCIGPVSQPCAGYKAKLGTIDCKWFSFGEGGRGPMAGQKQGGVRAGRGVSRAGCEQSRAQREQAVRASV